MKTLAALALTAAVTIFGAAEEHGFQGLNREAAPAVTTTTR